MKTVKKRIFAGAVCEQIVYNCGDNANVKKSKPRPRFKNDQEREEHRNGIKLRRFTRKVNANFTPNGYWCTLTFNEENECHEFADAAIARRNLARRLKYFDKTCKIIIVMGRGHSTSRIHFHMFVEGERINAETGRNFIGFEIDSEYFMAAKARIANTVQQISLFEEA